MNTDKTSSRGRRMAPSQYLLERLHDEGFLLSGLHVPTQTGEHGPSYRLVYGSGLHRDLGAAFIPMVLAPRSLPSAVERPDLLVDIRESVTGEFPLGAQRGTST